MSCSKGRGAPLHSRVEVTWESEHHGGTIQRKTEDIVSHKAEFSIKMGVAPPLPLWGGWEGRREEGEKEEERKCC